MAETSDSLMSQRFFYDKFLEFRWLKKPSKFWIRAYCAVTLQLVHKYIETLSRKVEGLDPLKPWQPFPNKEKKVLHSIFILLTCAECVILNSIIKDR